MSLAGKRIFITGGSRGIGLAIALRAAQDGALIAIAITGGAIARQNLHPRRLTRVYPHNLVLFVVRNDQRPIRRECKAKWHRQLRVVGNDLPQHRC